MINFNKCDKRFCSIEFDGIANSQGSRALYRLEQLTCRLLFQLNYESIKSSWVVRDCYTQSQVRFPCWHCSCVTFSLAVLKYFFFIIKLVDVLIVMLMCTNHNDLYVFLQKLLV
jgi:hypothetical protein